MSVINDANGNPIGDLSFQVALNQFIGLRNDHKFGHVDALSTTRRTVWTGGVDYAFPPTPETMYVSAVGTQDTHGGTGAEYMWVNYLTTSFAEVTEVVSLAGRTPVPLTSPVLRVNRMICLADDPTVKNLGVMWLGTSNHTAGVPSSVYAHIESATGQTYQAFYTVPRFEKAIVYDINITTNEGKGAQVEMFSRNNIETYSGFTDARNMLSPDNHYDVFETAFSNRRRIPLTYPEATDIEFKGKGSASGTNVSIEWTMQIVNSSFLGSLKR